MQTSTEKRVGGFNINYADDCMNVAQSTGSLCLIIVEKLNSRFIICSLHVTNRTNSDSDQHMESSERYLSIVNEIKCEVAHR